MFKVEVPLELLKQKLSAPAGFWETRDKKCNGCGSGWNASIVPDSIFFLNIKVVCCIHDRRYEIGGNATDKQRADLEFLSNLLVVINNYDRFFYPTHLAMLQALNYYEAVERVGYNSFNFTGINK